MTGVPVVGRLPVIIEEESVASSQETNEKKIARRQAERDLHPHSMK